MRFVGALVGLSASLLLAASSASAAAQADWGKAHDRCVSELNDMDLIVASCNLVIDSGKLDQAGLSVAYMSRGNAWNVKGDYDRALADYDQSIKLKADDNLTYNNRARAWLGKGEPDRAIADFNESIRLEPHLYAAYLGRSVAWRVKGDFKRAIEDLNVALGGNEDYAPILNARCWTRAVAGIELDKALHDCDRALYFSRNMPAIYDSHGFVQLRRGEFAKAIADEDQALKLNPKLPAALFVRGVAKLRLGRTDEGQADIAAAEALDPQLPGRYAAWGVTP